MANKIQNAINGANSIKQLIEVAKTISIKSDMIIWCQKALTFCKDTMEVCGKTNLIVSIINIELLDDAEIKSVFNNTLTFLKNSNVGTNYNEDKIKDMIQAYKKKLLMTEALQLAISKFGGESEQFSLLTKLLQSTNKAKLSIILELITLANSSAEYKKLISDELIIDEYTIKGVQSW